MEDFKKAVADVVCAELEAIQARYHECIESNTLNDVLAEGASRVRPQGSSDIA
ncbi:hypothetical protein MX850_01015 [Erysipelothrix sp. Poltava]|nr:hypothetical protein MX850_01015 [Erysipelothrix sp. Poltava]